MRGRGLTEDAFAILTCLPCEPAGVALSDLDEDYGESIVSRALVKIEAKYGLVRWIEDQRPFLAIPATSWEQASYDADVWWKKNLQK